MTFARGLRAILRQDPDVVMIGEIRDKETAEIAVQASLTGHLVLSTLHTNSAVGAITRLVDMGIEPFLLSSSVVGVLSQRLVRRLCDHCKQPMMADDSTQVLLGVSQPVTHYHAVGCEACFGQGYRGRLGLYELILIDDNLKTQIHNQAAEQVLEHSVRQRTPSLRMDGMQKVLSGQTSIEEVLRVTHAH
jgi:general secretion pathway protein E